MYRLTKNDLSNSAYYCAAETDIQPLLRFGDIISDYIYVSVGISENEFIENLKSKVQILCSQDNCGNILRINSIEKFNLSEIEHPHKNQLFQGKPEYMNDHDFNIYQINFNELRKNSEHYNLLITFTLKIGEIEKILRIYHYTGEALATYDAIFSKQFIAPKIFISVQTGIIEIPSKFTNKMFELHSKRPLVWIRGIEYEKNEIYQVAYDRELDNVFSTNGVYDEIIGEFMSWDSKFGIESSFDYTKSWRYIKAFGESQYWSEIANEIITEDNNVKIKKLLKPFNNNYTKALGSIDRQEISENIKYKYDGYLLNTFFEEYKYVSENYKIDEYRIASQAYNLFECYELYNNEFISNFRSLNNMKLSIDLYYKNKLDYKRDF